MKRKALFMVAALALLMAACSTDSSKTVVPKKPVITGQPEDGRKYSRGAEVEPLKVTATTKDKKAKLSYQWYSSTSKSAKGGTKIADAAGALVSGVEGGDFTPPIDLTAEVTEEVYYYYYVEVTSTLNKEKAKTTSSVAEITVIPDKDAVQVGPSDGSDGEVETGEDILLSVKLPDSIEELLESEDGDYEVLYQWYDNGTRNSNVGGTAIEGATEASYLPPTDVAGTWYYYVVVTVKNKETDEVVKTLTSNPMKVTVIVNTTIIDPTKENARKPLIRVPPEGSPPYYVGVPAAPLTVTATVSDNGALTYQWWRNTEDDNTGGERISGARSASYTPPTDEVGIWYYYVVITNTIEDNQDGGQKTAQSISEPVQVDVKKGQDAQVPVIPNTGHPVSALYRLLETATPLSVTASVTDKGTLTYQWFRKLENSNENGEPVTEATTEKTFVPPTAVKSLVYYYVEVTNTIPDNGDGGTKTATAKSNPAYIGTEITPLNIGGLTAQNKVYNGTTLATLTGTATLTPPLGAGAGVSLVQGTAEFAQTDVGTDIPVTLVGWYLTGEKANDYILYVQTGLKANITKAAGASVTRPVVSTTSPPTSFKITVDEVTLDASATDLQRAQQDVEYTLGSNNTTITSYWRDSPVFTGLTVDTTYYIFARSKASDNYNAGTTNNVSAAIRTVVGSPVTKPDSATATVTHNSIGVVAVTVTQPEKGQSVQYAIATDSITSASQLAWRANPLFTSLNPGTTYYIYARSAQNEDYAAGTPNISNPIGTAQPLVTFETNGGSPVDSVTVIKGNTMSAPTAPTKEGYTFDHWYTSSNFSVPWDFGAPVIWNMNLHAKWVSNTEIAMMRNSKDMEWIKGGSFIMGDSSNPPESNDVAPHRVTLSGFWMGKHEVTQEKWQEIMMENPSSFKTAVQGEDGTPGKLPVDSVSWFDALVFCNKLSIAEGLTPAYQILNANGNGAWSVYPVEWGVVPTTNTEDAKSRWETVRMVSGSTGYRLPTEAQWEYACRAGTTTAYCTGNTWIDAIGWYRDNSSSKTHKVGLKPTGVNAYGGNQWELYDMHGNVSEWCWDWFSHLYYAECQVNPPVNPTGPAAGASGTTGTRAIRSGNWNNTSNYLRSFYHWNGDNPYKRGNNNGLRLVRP